MSATPQTQKKNTAAEQSSDGAQKQTAEQKIIAEQKQRLADQEKRFKQLEDKVAKLSGEEKRTADGKIVPEIRFSYLEEDGKNRIIKSWQVIVDDIKVTNVGLLEDQQVRVEFFEGEHKDMQLRDFYRLVKKQPVEINVEKSTLSWTKAHSGDQVLNVPLLEIAVFEWKGKEYSLPISFIN